MRSLQALLVVGVLLVVAVFAGVNLAPVRIDYVLGTVDLPLAAALYVALLIGATCGVAGASGMVRRARRATRRARADARKVQPRPSTPAAGPVLAPKGTGTAPDLAADARR